MGSQRYISIDMMRGLAIAGMVLCHFIIEWSMPEKNPFVYFMGDHLLGDWPAAFFTFLVGVSLAISIARREEKGEDKALTRLRGVKRGLFVIAVGLLLAVCTLGPASIFAWDILALIGAALILLQYLKDARPAWIATGCIGIILITPYLQKACGYLTYWGGGVEPVPVITALVPNILYNPICNYIPGFGMQAVTGFFVTGYFPIFPWIIFPLMGFLVGKTLFTDRLTVSPGWKFPQSLGILCIILGIFIGYAGSVRPSPEVVGTILAPFSFYPETTAMLLLQFGFALCVLEVLRRLFDGQKTHAPWVKIPERLNRYSLTLYIVHMLIIYIPIEILTSLYPGSTPFIETLNPLTGLGIGILFLIGFTILSGYWDRIRGKYSFEWIMAKVIGD
jgi:uncharacterized membrane protein